MKRREMAAWLLVAFMAGSVATPTANAGYYNFTAVAEQLTKLVTVGYAIRNASARNCEAQYVLRAMQIAPSDRYYQAAQRCWR